MQKILPLICLGLLLYCRASGQTFNDHSLETFQSPEQKENVVTHTLSAFDNQRFEENKGQIANERGAADHDVLFVMKDQGVTLYFYADGIRYRFQTLEKDLESEIRVSEATGKPVGDIEDDRENKTFRTHEVRMSWLNSNSNVHIAPSLANSDHTNYYLSHCRDGITNVRSYRELTYKDLYPGIDAKYYFKDGKLKYDLIVKKGADLRQVRIGYAGADRVTLENGVVEIITPLGNVVENEPIAFTSKGESLIVNYDQSDAIGFNVEGNAVATEDLIIDPLLSWRTFYGGAGNDEGLSVATDANGNVFMSGKTASTSGIASGGYQNANGGGSWDAFLVKFDLGGARLWATYYGASGDDIGYAVRVNISGESFVAGSTSSTGGIASGGHQATFGTGLSDGFIVKFSASGTRVWGTYYGGTGEDIIRSMDMDASGNIYVAGETTSDSGIASSGLESSRGGGRDGFVAKFSTGGTRQWGRYFGGADSDWGYTTRLDPSGNVYFSGYTNSSAGISTLGPAFAGVYDVFLTKFSSSGALTWSTYFGGPAEDYCYAMGCDAQGNITLGGKTNSTSGIGGIAPPSGFTGMVAKFNSSGTKLESSYTSTSANYGLTFDEVRAIVFDPFGNRYVGGTGSIYGTTGKVACWQIKVGFSNNYTFDNSTYNQTGSGNNDYTLNSITVDAFGNSYFAGSIVNTGAPGGGETQPSIKLGEIGPWASTGFQNSNGGNRDAFLVRTHMELARALPFNNGGAQILVDQSGNAYFTVDANNSLNPNQSTVGFQKVSSNGTVLAGGSRTGNVADFPASIAFDASGNVYVAGYTSTTTGFATGGHQNSYGGGTNDAFLAKFNSSGSVVWCTYYGGSAYDVGQSVSVDASGNVYLIGYTQSSNGIASGGYQNTLGGASDIFIAKFSSSGVRQWATYYGGAAYENGYASAIDLNGNIYVSGTSTSNGLASTGAHQTTNSGAIDGLLAKFSPTGSRIWATYYGGTGEEGISAIAVDQANNIIAHGSTTSTSGIASGGFQNSYAGGYDAYIVKFTESGARLWGSYFGGPDLEMEGTQVATDVYGNVYVAGKTKSDSGISDVNAVQRMPEFFNGINPSNGFVNGDTDGFLVKVGPNGNKISSSYLGAGYTNSFLGVSVDPGQQSIWVSALYTVTKYNNFSPPSAVTQPTTQPTSLVVNGATTSTLNVTWTAAAGSPNFYLVVRRAGAAPTGVPTDGTSYNIGQALGDGTVVYKSFGTQFTDSGLSTGTTYFYSIYSFNGTGSQTNYLTTSPLTGSGTTIALATEPTAQPTGFSVSNNTTSSFTVSFTAAAGSPSYLAIRRQGAAPTGTPVDGVAYSVGQALGNGTVVKAGTGASFSNTGLSSGTTYYFKIFSFNTAGHFSGQNYLLTNPLSGTGTTTTPCTPPCQETRIAVSWVGNDAEIALPHNLTGGSTILLERSFDGINFHDIEGKWNSLHGNPYNTFDLNARDNAASEIFYRIRYTSDDKVYHSETATLENDDLVIVSPNPAKSILNVTAKHTSGLMSIGLIDPTGRQIEKREPAEEMQFDVRSLANGLYCVTLDYGVHGSKAVKVMILH